SSLLLSVLLLSVHSTSPTHLYSLSLHDALPICPALRPSSRSHPVRQHLHRQGCGCHECAGPDQATGRTPHSLVRRDLQPALPLRSEEHTSELQSRFDLVCRLLLEKKKRTSIKTS